MIDIEAINNTIEHLEQSEETTTSVCNKLANLYIVREYFNKPKEDIITLELSDILPSYLKYVELKRNYQLKQLDIDTVESAMVILCKEIYEFIQVLYSNTESSVERKEIRNLIEHLEDIV